MTYRFRATLICRPSSSLNGPVGRRNGFLIEIKMIVFFTVFSSLKSGSGVGGIIRVFVAVGLKNNWQPKRRYFSYFGTSKLFYA